MGMSASQSRLLSLTSRLSDLEYQAQSISNQKIRLSDKQTDASKAYEDALDAQKLTVTNSNGDQINANAYNLTTYGVMPKPRMLENAAGKMMVSEDVATAYKDANGDIGAFLANFVDSASAATSLNTALQSSDAYSNLSGTNSKDAVTYLKGIESQLTAELSDSDITADTKTDIKTLLTSVGTVIDWLSDNKSTTSSSDLTSDQNLLQLLSSGESSDGSTTFGGVDFSGLSTINIASVLSEVQTDKGSADSDYTNESGESSYYTSLFMEMKSNGYETISSENMTDNEWLTDQLEAGNLYIVEYDDEGGSNGTGAWEEISYTSGDSALQLADKSDSEVAKAEAEYETTMAEIEAKDNRYDLELKTIDTEHSAVQTEVESVKKVIDKNIERSFKIFDA